MPEPLGPLPINVSPLNSGIPVPKAHIETTNRDKSPLASKLTRQMPRQLTFSSKDKMQLSKTAFGLLTSAWVTVPKKLWKEKKKRRRREGNEEEKIKGDNEEQTREEETGKPLAENKSQHQVLQPCKITMPRACSYLRDIGRKQEQDDLSPKIPMPLKHTTSPACQTRPRKTARQLRPSHVPRDKPLYNPSSSDQQRALRTTASSTTKKRKPP